MKLAVSELKTPNRKTRKHSPEQLRDIMQSISALDFCAPLLVDQGNMVLDGEARLEAARQLGLPEVPCIHVAHVSEAERRSLRLALNRLGEKAEWDLEALKLELEELIVLEAPIHIFGFGSDEIDQIILDEAGPALETGPLEPEPKAEPIARLGDVWLLGENRLICGDAADPTTYRALFAETDNLPRLVVTDEPYKVPIAGHVSGGAHREFAMAYGEMSHAELLAFNKAWIAGALPPPV